MDADARQRIAGVILLFGFVYIVFEFIAAAAWVDPPYDWARNTISDLGFSDCAIVKGDRICSPLHPLMNAGFMVQGTVFTIGGMLAASVILPGGWQRMVVGVLLAVSGIGTFAVGVVHQSVALLDAGLNWVHILAATLAIGPGDVGILLLGLAAISSERWRWYGVSIAVLGAVGILAGILLVIRVDFGVGLGLVERLAVYPLNAWTIGSGVGLLAIGIRDRALRERARRESIAGTA